MPTRIVLFNVKYSPNLGDGLLSECLERELGNALPGCVVESVDLAGRQDYPIGAGRGRAIVMSVLEKCPGALRQIAVWTMLRALVALRLTPHYRSGLAGAEAVVVGGGNLLTDADLNFPIKISGALAEAARHDLPVAVYAVGVSPTWSRAGRRIFARALQRSRLVWTSVRDQRSRDAWADHLSSGNVPTPQIVVDPGVLASLHYPQALPQRGSRKVGLCITDPLAVRYHGGGPNAANLDSWYPEALRSLVTQGFEVTLFTNGSPEDREYLQTRAEAWMRYAGGPVTLQRAFETPADLAKLVSGCDAVVGHRMHACIAAYSFGVPTIGLRWDVKLDSFFALSGRAHHVLDPSKLDAAELGALTEAAIADRFDPAPLIARARREVADFAAHLRLRVGATA